MAVSWAIEAMSRGARAKPFFAAKGPVIGLAASLTNTIALKEFGVAWRAFGPTRKLAFFIFALDRLIGEAAGLWRGFCLFTGTPLFVFAAGNHPRLAGAGTGIGAVFFFGATQRRWITRACFARLAFSTTFANKSAL